MSTGTDSVASNLVLYILHPTAEVTLYIFRMPAPGQPTDQLSYQVLYTWPMAWVLLQSLAVAFTYILVFSFIAWFALKRAEVKG